MTGKGYGIVSDDSRPTVVRADSVLPEAAAWVGLSPVAVWQCHLLGKHNPGKPKGLWHATHTATHPQKVAVWQSALRPDPEVPPEFRPAETFPWLRPDHSFTAPMA
jgi:hypothetical protein